MCVIGERTKFIFWQNNRSATTEQSFRKLLFTIAKYY